MIRRDDTNMFWDHYVPEHSEKQATSRCILYFGNPEDLLKLLEKKDTISITYYPAVNEFRGKKTLQIMIQDFQ